MKTFDPIQLLRLVVALPLLVVLAALYFGAPGHGTASATGADLELDAVQLDVQSW